MCLFERDNQKALKAIINGQMDDYPENAFMMAGTIDDVKNFKG